MVLGLRLLMSTLEMLKAQVGGNHIKVELREGALEALLLFVHLLDCPLVLPRR